MDRQPPQMRRFASKGATLKARQLCEEPHGTFMLHSNFVDYHNQRNKDEDELHTTIRLLKLELERSKEQTERARSIANLSRGEPTHWGVSRAGSVISVWPTKDLANSAALCAAYQQAKAIKQYSLIPMWGPV